jgi:hypothetical protein
MSGSIALHRVSVLGFSGSEPGIRFRPSGLSFMGFRGSAPGVYPVAFRRGTGCDEDVLARGEGAEQGACGVIFGFSKFRGSGASG